MAKRQRSGVLNRLAGKKFAFSGKFSHGVEDVLKAMAEAQQAGVCDDLDPKVDYLVLADLSAGKTIQKKAMTLNGKGATIQVIDVDGFEKLAEPTDDEILALLRAGEMETFVKIGGSRYFHGMTQRTFCSEDFSAVNLKNAHLENIHFDGCRFIGAKLEGVRIAAATDCDFSNVSGHFSKFGDVPGCRFNQATLNGCGFAGDASGADFTSAALDEASFGGACFLGFGRTKTTSTLGAVFAKASLKSARFHELHLKSPDFGGADLTQAVFSNCSIDSGTFAHATLREAVLVGCKLAGADLTDADLMGANLAGADLTGAKMDGADLKNANPPRVQRRKVGMDILSCTPEKLADAMAHIIRG